MASGTENTDDTAPSGADDPHMGLAPDAPGVILPGAPGQIARGAPGQMDPGAPGQVDPGAPGQMNPWDPNPFLVRPEEGVVTEEIPQEVFAQHPNGMVETAPPLQPTPASGDE